MTSSSAASEGGIFTLSPLCRREESNKTQGNSKSNTQESTSLSPARFRAKSLKERNEKGHRSARKCIMIRGFSVGNSFLMTNWLWALVLCLLKSVSLCNLVLLNSFLCFFLQHLIAFWEPRCVRFNSGSDRNFCLQPWSCSGALTVRKQDLRAPIKDYQII